jgi:hypothetical protein
MSLCMYVRWAGCSGIFVLGCPSLPKAGFWLVRKGHVCRWWELILPKSIGSPLWFHAQAGDQRRQKALFPYSGKAKAGDNFAKNAEHFPPKSQHPKCPKTE